jgi:hypothetical protein
VPVASLTAPAATSDTAPAVSTPVIVAVDDLINVDAQALAASTGTARITVTAFFLP